MYVQNIVDLAIEQIYIYYKKLQFQHILEVCKLNLIIQKVIND